MTKCLTLLEKDFPFEGSISIQGNQILGVGCNYRIEMLQHSKLDFCQKRVPFHFCIYGILKFDTSSYSRLLFPFLISYLKFEEAVLEIK